MRFRRAAAWLAAGILFLSGAMSCSRPTGGPAEGKVLSADELSRYLVIRSDEGDEALVRSGMVVREALADAGCPVKLTTDFYREGLTTFTIVDEEILVGETNRPETAEFLDSLAPWQWGYALVGTKIVIAGHDDDGTRAAADAFCENIAKREPLRFSESDRYIYGDVPEGAGRVYSILAADKTAGADNAGAAIAEYGPEIVFLREADGEAGEEIPAGYAAAAEYRDGSALVRILYRTAAYTYSSDDAIPLLNNPNLADADRGALVYTVLRCRDTGEKMVFAAAELPPDTSFGTRMKVAEGFLNHTGDLPAVLVGTGLGLDGKHVETEESFMKVGYAGAVRIAAEKTGEEDPDLSLFVPYLRLAPSKTVSEDGILYAEIQKAK